MEKVVDANSKNFANFIRQFLESVKAIQVGEERGDEGEVNGVFRISFPQVLCKLSDLLNHLLDDHPRLPRNIILVLGVSKLTLGLRITKLIFCFRICAELLDELRIKGKDYEKLNYHCLIVGVQFVILIELLVLLDQLTDGS